MVTIWSFIKMLIEVWEAIKVFLGLVKKAEHEREQKEIDDAAKAAGDPDKSLDERLKAGKELEDKFNSHT